MCIFVLIHQKVTEAVTGTDYSMSLDKIFEENVTMYLLPISSANAIKRASDPAFFQNI